VRRTRARRAIAIAVRLHGATQAESAGTARTARTETIRDDVRRVEVDVQTLGGAPAASGYEADFRQRAKEAARYAWERARMKH
jgi:hypothetical protein